VLTLPLRNSSYQFNPQTVEALDGIGTVYPTLHIADDWGVLEVDSGGALVDKDMTRVTVSAQGIDLGHAAGSGWHLTLQKGWSIAPGPRSGDLVVQRAQTGGKM